MTGASPGHTHVGQHSYTHHLQWRSAPWSGSNLSQLNSNSKAVQMGTKEYRFRLFSRPVGPQPHRLPSPAKQAVEGCKRWPSPVERPQLVIPRPPGSSMDRAVRRVLKSWRLRVGLPGRYRCRSGALPTDAHHQRCGRTSPHARRHLHVDLIQPHEARG
jgi:hypothetical protein